MDHLHSVCIFAALAHPCDGIQRIVEKMRVDLCLQRLQLGLTQEVIQGTADEKTMLAYYNGTIAPILTAIIEEFTRKFLTKTARSQGQRIRFFRDPFKLVPVEQLAEIADKFTRNKIATSNELRAVIGWVPSDDPSADKLENSNLNQPTTEGGETPDEQEDV
jgi:hypothetical protein